MKWRVILLDCKRPLILLLFENSRLANMYWKCFRGVWKQRGTWNSLFDIFFICLATRSKTFFPQKLSKDGWCLLAFSVVTWIQWLSFSWLFCSNNDWFSFQTYRYTHDCVILSCVAHTWICLLSFQQWHFSKFQKDLHKINMLTVNE